MTTRQTPAARSTRADDLASAFQAIARTRMAGMPMCNAALRVEAVGFEWSASDDDVAVGILITPWFMNLVRLPAQRLPTEHGIGRTEKHAIGGTEFDFIGAYEPAIGAFSACSLFSPMFEFGDHEAARATALAALATLRTATADDKAVARATTPALAPPPPARRSFLFGRSATRSSAP